MLLQFENSELYVFFIFLIVEVYSSSFIINMW